MAIATPRLRPPLDPAGLAALLWVRAGCSEGNRAPSPDVVERARPGAGDGAVPDSEAGGSPDGMAGGSPDGKAAASPDAEAGVSLDGEAGASPDGGEGGDLRGAREPGAECSVGVGACARTGRQVCDPSGSGEMVCDGVPGARAPERCGNKVDEDCDGRLDNGEAFRRLGLPCLVGVGPCEEGVFVCRGDGRAVRCSVTARTPSPELCDGLDNDRDGEIDEDFDLGFQCTSVEGGCGADGETVCAADGDGTECAAVYGDGGPEVCDSVDNDCDGETDEADGGGALTRPCYTGPAETADVGACRSGTRVCDAPAPGVEARSGRCTGEVLPAVERCNRRDDDCDGEVDEGAGCGCPAVEVPAGYVCIEPGEFQMGAQAGEPGGSALTEVLRRVEITRPFLLKATEVTQGEWLEVFDDNPSWFDRCGDDCPVDPVSWYDALEYCNRLSDAAGLDRCYRVDGCHPREPPFEDDTGCDELEVLSPGGNPSLCEGFRLPTEAEWEYAARAGTQTAFHTGDFGPRPDGVGPPGGEALARAGWCSGNGERKTHPVAQKEPNVWGLFDVHGNVREWTWDVWREDPEALGVQDPVNSVQRTSVAGPRRVHRGGAYLDLAGDCRAANRGRRHPGFNASAFGVRPARSIP